MPAKAENHLTKRSRQRLLRVARAIRNHEINGLGFNLNAWVSVRSRYNDMSDNPHFCGTTACIAGYAAAMSVPVRAPEKKIKGLIKLHGRQVLWDSGVEKAAAAWLGIPGVDAFDLFLGNGRDQRKFSNLKDVTASQAIATLIKFAKTGVVDWQARPSAWNNPEKHLAALAVAK